MSSPSVRSLRGLLSLPDSVVYSRTSWDDRACGAMRLWRYGRGPVLASAAIARMHLNKLFRHSDIELLVVMAVTMKRQNVEHAIFLATFGAQTTTSRVSIILSTHHRVLEYEHPTYDSPDL